MVDSQSLNNRAKRKVTTNTMVLSLVDVARADGDNEAQQQY